jgi:hypothetical protein
MAFMQHEFFGLLKTNSTLNIPILKPNLLSLISIAPHAIINCMLRPFPRELHSSFLFVCLLDNLILIVLTVATLFFLREKKSLNWSFIWFCIFYTLGIFVLIGTIVSNLGALVRYKNTGMLFWLVVLIYLVDWEKVKKRFGIKRNSISLRNGVSWPGICRVASAMQGQK